MKIDVLNGGFVRLVSYMQPVPEVSDAAIQGDMVEVQHQPLGWTGDLEIVRNARVSHNADWRAGDDDGKDARLIGYLYRNNHSTPFEAMVFTFEVKAPIFILRQWHRHRTWSYNEISARYTKLDEGYYIPAPEEIRQQDTRNKQASAEQHERAGEAWRLIEETCAWSKGQYHLLLEMGVSREMARSVLPVATYSRMFATVDLHNLFHFLRLRLHSHAQPQIRVYAEALLKLIEPVVPHAVAAFKETIS